jgi:phosphate transport system substrate-binding protein
MKSLATVAAGFLFLSAGVTGAEAADAIRINGSGSALDLLKPVVAAYKKANKAAEFKIEKPLGSSGAIKALGIGALDLVVTSKPLTAEDTAKGLQLREFGKTPLAIVTEKGVKKNDLSIKELEDIYSGKTTTWPGNEKIRLVLRPQGDIDTKILADLSPDMAAAVTAAASRTGMIMAVTDPESYGAIGKTPGAVGATGLTSILVEKLPLNILSINKVKPSPKSLANGSYPLAKRIDFVITAKSSPEALKFVEFAYSKQGRAIAEKSGVLVTAPSR